MIESITEMRFYWKPNHEHISYVLFIYIVNLAKVDKFGLCILLYSIYVTGYKNKIANTYHDSCQTYNLLHIQPEKYWTYSMKPMICFNFCHIFFLLLHFLRLFIFRRNRLTRCLDSNSKSHPHIIIFLNAKPTQPYTQDYRFLAYWTLHTHTIHYSANGIRVMCAKKFSVNVRLITSTMQCTTII